MSGGYLAFGSALKSLARNMAPASGAKTVSSQHHSVSMFGRGGVVGLWQAIGYMGDFAKGVTDAAARVSRLDAAA